MSNFSFLLAEWPLLYESATKAKDTAHTDARAACFYGLRTIITALRVKINVRSVQAP